MKNSEQLVRTLQIPNPCVPGAVFETVAEAREEHDHWEDRVRRMKGHDNVSDQARYRSNNGNATLAEVVVDQVAGESRGQVAHKGCEEEEGDKGVVDAIVRLDLPASDTRPIVSQPSRTETVPGRVDGVSQRLLLRQHGAQ